MKDYEVTFRVRPESKRRYGRTVLGQARSFADAKKKAEENCPDRRNLYVSMIKEVRLYEMDK